MGEISRVKLFGKLNSLCYKSIESATVFCKMRGNRYVELVHWLNQILQLQDSDIHHLIQHFDLNPSALAKDFTEALDRLPRGATSVSDLSAHVEEAVERAWVYATLLYGESQVRSAYLIIGALKTPELKNVLYGISAEFKRIKIDTLTDELSDIVGKSPEESMQPTDGSNMAAASADGQDAISGDGGMVPAQMGRGQALAQFTVDLTEDARQGKIDPIVGRDEEIRQVVDILMRRRQNNPILTGEAGVGKTAVVEGFALRIARGDVPPPMEDVSLLSLDVGALQAGASMKGEFENRLKQVIEEVQSSEKPIIMFIDEAHTLVGAGGAAGTGDAANLLKPALARGTLRTVAATTWAEYKKHIEKDPALTRRFQVVQVDEPSEEKAIQMMRGMASSLEKHHQVQILDEALEASVVLSHRYIPARQLPDKSISLLDTASARVAISQHAVPAQVDDLRKLIQSLETEKEIIQREKIIGMDVAEREQRVDEALAENQTTLAELEKRWQEEQALVSGILALRKQLREQGISPDDEADEENPEQDRDELLTKLHAEQAKLHDMQGDEPLILPTVDAQAVATVVQDWTGVPVGRMVKNEMETVMDLADLMEKRLVGQRHALDMIAKRIQTSRASLDNPNKPIGVFMLAGTSGVGKTETALALAETLYGGEQNVITINMSEFQEAHTVSTLKGAPPGYVGYGEGGVLTEAVRRRPYSVVLLDEVEKAHTDVHEIFFQVFDKGWMEDGEGRQIDFKNTLILLTTNAGTDLIMNLCKDPELMPDPEGISKALREPLLKVFPPALLGRLVVIPYYPLNDEMIGAIARLQLGRIQQRIMDNHNISFNYDDDVIKLIAERCTEVDSGGRMIDAILTNTVLPAISQTLLQHMMQGTSLSSVTLKVKDGEFDYQYGNLAED
jgi:type VI secretion system protein VasG